MIAVGDGANDLGMLHRAGMGVALHAKPAVAAECDVRINFGDLTALLYVQGYAKSDLCSGETGMGRCPIPRDFLPFGIGDERQAKTGGGLSVPVMIPRRFSIGALRYFRASGWLASSAPSFTRIEVIAHSAARLVPQAALRAMPIFWSGRIAMKKPSAPVFSATLPFIARIRLVQARVSPATRSGCRRIA